ncbi:hypothetical protein I302_105780 [Kwoniella bestiolae CBS 10118]|uniref:Zn(2)-C6 fungal-type domain-containing protein n=1 Tax=Kwoniella bestiolae CBS 10118 TaxID=1296100 RepID=A0A1B9G238_9TREE|nr:hypothetical protein I302_04902 [Kwoniella bestiolae CBS 10118]OCF25092.1 hypothetical protein I302_04902 [Kwoniella bestiolae CBS 10118]
MPNWWEEFLLTTVTVDWENEQMPQPYPHAEGSNYPHQTQNHDPQQSRSNQRGRPPAINLPQNPYGHVPPHSYSNDQHGHPHAHHIHQQSDQVQQVQGYYPPPPPPNIFYAAENQPPGPPVNMTLIQPYDSNIQPKLEHDGPSVLLPPHQHHIPNQYLDHHQQQHQHQQQMQQPMILSPYEMPLGSGSSHNPNMAEYFPPLHTPTGIPIPMDSGSSQNTAMVDYFPPPSTLQHQQSQPPQNLVSTMPIDHSHQAWQSTVPAPIPTGNAKNNASAGPSTKAEKAGSKTTRQQFTACGACRHRRVKCDLKDKQEAAEKSTMEDTDGVGPSRNKGVSKQKKVSCTNCIERGLNCIDEFAPLKAAKQLRRGKRISEIEMLFGKTAASAAVAHQTGEPSSDASLSPIKAVDRGEIIPDLTKEFFDSAFFRRFQVQRPVLDPQNFIGRYLSNPIPTASAMGPEGAILCHVLYAWAVSYGVDEYGQLDVPEGGGAPLESISLLSPGDAEMNRENDRQKRKEKMRFVIEIILKEIDEYGLMRKPTWDGVRVLLLVLPLTDGIASPVERLSMYEAAISQVFTLCSFVAMGYDGQPSGTAGVNGGSDDLDGQDLVRVRVRIYWYAFVHEGITTGLKGGRLHLDDEDLETMQDSIDHRSLVRDSAAFRLSSRFATAPINLALACRKINKALTGPAAKRRTAVNGDLVKQAWEALERCWEDFDQLKYEASSSGPSFAQGDEVIRFADGWKIFLFEAQNVIRNNLEDRISKLAQAQTTAFITESNPSTPEAMHNDLVNAQHLLDISKSKCEVQTRQIMEIVRRHVGTRFFEWDASLVRDGTYYTAMLLARSGGSDEDIQICIRALNELRWAHAKAWERSIDLRKEWQERPSMSADQAQMDGTWEAVLSDLAKLTSENQNNQMSLQSDAQSRSTTSSHSNHHPQSSFQTQPPPPQQQYQQHHHQHQHVHHHHHSHHNRLSSHNSEPTPSSTSPPYTSPAIVSPTFDTSGIALMRGYIPTSNDQRNAYSSSGSGGMLDPVDEGDNVAYRNWINSNQSDGDQSNPRMYNPPQHMMGQQTSPKYQVYTTATNNTSNIMPPHLGPPPLKSNQIMPDGNGNGSYQQNEQGQGQGQGQGQYLLKEDGTHVFVPYKFL